MSGKRKITYEGSKVDRARTIYREAVVESRIKGKRLEARVRSQGLTMKE